MIAVNPVDGAGDEHQQTARQTDPQNRYDCPQCSVQLLPDKDGHVRGIQTGKALADRQHFNEFLVAQPSLFADKTPTEIRHNATETGCADRQKFQEYAGDRNPTSSQLTALPP